GVEPQVLDSPKSVDSHPTDAHECHSAESAGRWQLISCWAIGNAPRKRDVRVLRAVRRGRVMGTTQAKPGIRLPQGDRGPVATRSGSPSGSSPARWTRDGAP